MNKIFLLLTLMACTDDPGEPGATPVGAETYHEGMWEARAMTVAAGLTESEALYRDGAKAEAQAMLDAVYTGSFEPELEAAVRLHIDPRRSTGLEYRFGVVRKLMARPRAEARVSEAILLLNQDLNAAAKLLDKAQATLGLE